MKICKIPNLDGSVTNAIAVKLGLQLAELEDYTHALFLEDGQVSIVIAVMKIRQSFFTNGYAISYVAEKFKIRNGYCWESISRMLHRLKKPTYHTECRSLFDSLEIKQNAAPPIRRLEIKNHVFNVPYMNSVQDDSSIYAGNHFFDIFWNNECIGFLDCSLSGVRFDMLFPLRIELYAIMIDAKFQSKGIGRCVMEHLKSHQTIISLNTASNAKIALSFYEKYQFRISSETSGIVFLEWRP